MTLTSVEPPAAHHGLVEGRFDIAVTFDYDIDPAAPPAPVTRESLLDDPVLVALPSGHPLASRGSIRLERLATEPWIAAPLAGLPLASLREAAGRGFAPQVRYEGEDFAAVLALVASKPGRRAGTTTGDVKSARGRGAPAARRRNAHPAPVHGTTAREHSPHGQRVR
jgi:DNA-binding transcriptional LysR family regulator